MRYIDGFLVPVPTDGREAYRAAADEAAEVFLRHGATRVVEGWGDDVPRGTTNDLWAAVQANEDETVAYSWIEYPDRATRDAASAAVAQDPVIQAMGANTVFDGKRMVWGGFRAISDAGSGEAGYIDGVVLPLPDAGHDAFRGFAEACARLFLDHGAVRVIDTVADDVPDGTLTDFNRAILRQAGESASFGWVEWPDRAARDAGWEKAMADPRMADMAAPFDGKRMIFGGFTPIVDRRA